MQIHQELDFIITEAVDIALQTNRPLSSLHLLLALFTRPHPIQEFFSEIHLDQNVLLNSITHYISEDPQIYPDIIQKSLEVARSSKTKSLGSVHILFSLLSHKKSAAYIALQKTNADISLLRNRLLGNMLQPTFQKDENFSDQDFPKQQKYKTVEDLKTIFRLKQENQTRSKEFSDERKKIPIIEPHSFTKHEKSRFETDDNKNKEKESFSKVSNALKEPKAFSIDPNTCPALHQFTRNITLAAANGELDYFIGRDHLIEEMLDILCQRRTNNPCLIGEPGVGKTALVEGLAQKMLDSSEPSLKKKIILELNLGILLAGTEYRGSLNARLNQLKAEVKANKEQCIIFIDEIHMLIGAGATHDKNLDASNDLKAALARGEFPCIGATTFDEFKKYIEGDPALVRRFQPITVHEPNFEESLLILQGVAATYEKYHDVTYSDEVIKMIVELSTKYIHERSMPDKAISVLDRIGARVKRDGQKSVQKDHVLGFFASRIQLPLSFLSENEQEYVENLTRDLEKKVFGQNVVISKLAHKIGQRQKQTHEVLKPSSFLFWGSPGSGKTLLAMELGEILYENPKFFCRFDMGEYTDPHSATRLLGSPPGYVGYQQGGQLTEFVKRIPNAVLLFDSIHKCHPDITRSLLPILEFGELTDNSGKKISFRHAIILFTVTTDSHFGCSSQKLIGFYSNRENQKQNEEITHLKNIIESEFVERIETILGFAIHTYESLKEIFHHLQKKFFTSLQNRFSIGLNIPDQTIDILTQTALSSEEGARKLLRLFKSEIEDPAMEWLVQNNVSSNEHEKTLMVFFDSQNKKCQFKFLKN